MKISIIALTIWFSLSLLGCGSPSSKSSSLDTGANELNMDSVESMVHSLDSTSLMPDATDSLGMMSEMEKGMDRMNKNIQRIGLTGNIDHDLISRLKAHHQGAIEISRVEIKMGTEPKQRTIATRIIAAKSKETNVLSELSKTAQKEAYDSAEANNGLGKALKENLAKLMNMTELTPGTPDHEFTSMMLKHHKDGNDLGRIIVKYANSEQLRSLAKKMIARQNQELVQLQETVDHH